MAVLICAAQPICAWFRAVRIFPWDTLRVTKTAGVLDYRIDRTFIVKPEDVCVLALSTAPTLTPVISYSVTFIGHAQAVLGQSR